MTEKKDKFELKKGMNVVRTRYPRNMTRMDMKIIHLIQIQLKKWALDNDFKPIDDVDVIDSYKDVKTSFDISIDDFAQAIGSNKKSLTAIQKDENGKTIIRNGYPLRKVTEHLTSAVEITIEIDSQFLSGAMSPVAAGTYHTETGLVNLRTNDLMAAVLLDSAFEKNSSFVDMKLQMQLKSLMATHLLDRISRFKNTNTNYQCTVRSLIEECAIDEKTISHRDRFINGNLRRPLEQIEQLSEGVWKRVGVGCHVTMKVKKTLSLDDVITFKMNYKAPKEKEIKQVEETPAYEFGDLDAMTTEELNNEVMLFIYAVENGEKVGKERLDVCSGIGFRLLSEKSATFDPVRFMNATFKVDSNV